MTDGSHLLASERGRRKIDPITGERMIRHMVLTEHAWPHWEWTEDVAGPDGPGPWGPGVGVWMPDDPNRPSPREAWRPILEAHGRLDLLETFADHNFSTMQDDEPDKPYVGSYNTPIRELVRPWLEKTNQTHLLELYTTMSQAEIDLLPRKPAATEPQPPPEKPADVKK